MSTRLMLNGREVFTTDTPSKHGHVIQRALNLPHGFAINWDKYTVVHVPGQGDQVVEKSKLKTKDGKDNPLEEIKH